MTFTLTLLPHEHLPPPLNAWVASNVLLEDVPQADAYLLAVCAILVTFIAIQLRSFARPPPVPLKRLPQRPLLSILFQPDDTMTRTTTVTTTTTTATTTTTTTATTTLNGSVIPKQPASHLRSTFSSTPSVPRWRNRLNQVTQRLNFTGRDKEDPVETIVNHHDNDDNDNDYDNDDDDFADETEDDEEEKEDADRAKTTTATASTAAASSTAPPGAAGSATFAPFHDLPDSFAPLLSSSQLQVLYQQLTADLIHAIQAEATVRMHPGRHEIPLNKDSSRPQLLLDVPSTGCKLSAVAMVGSDGCDSAQDLNVHQPTTKRSTPMVKHAGLVLDPPLPLSNVAPTLIHFPSLFEDNWVPTLRRIQIVRHCMDFLVSMSTFLEKCLWILESQCQIHLGKVRIVPLYKGSNTTTTSNTTTAATSQTTPDWRLSLSFSGHVLLFGWIPIPFISVTLPTFIIPQPHALLTKLLTPQPLASARLRRENIAEQRIALALVRTAESWTSEVKVVATPPALGVEVTLAGGVSIAMELGLGRDPQAGRYRHVDKGGSGDMDSPKNHTTTAGKQNNGGGKGEPTMHSDNSMSSWTTNVDNSAAQTPGGGHRSLLTASSTPLGVAKAFDANELVPWSLVLSAKGTVSHHKLSVHILKFAANYDGLENGVTVKSHFALRGSLAVWLPQASDVSANDSATPMKRRMASFPNQHRRAESFGRLALESEETPSVASLLLFPEECSSFRQEQRMLKYDYAFDVSDHTCIDAITVSVGASHPMLNGGTMVTVILESIYAFGSMAARDDSLFDPSEFKRKREILRHLPATDFTFGINNAFIPPESRSYSDDGQTLFVPSVRGGRMKLRLIGGVDGPEDGSFGSNVSNITPADTVAEGIKLVADFEVPSLILRTEGRVKEFPELDVFEGTKLRTVLAGIVVGGVRAHLRPQVLTAPVSSTGPNIFNPLEAYEIDFSGSSLSLKMKEFTASLGHRRIIFPTESTLVVKVVESVVDMGFEGKTECELGWDFQGLSPILQVTSPGTTPADAVPENKEQVSLLIAPLRQGRFSLKVSPVGGITITKAATVREDKEGLYDWKFFNAIVSPDNESPGRILDVLHDKRTMDKVLQITKLINADLHKILGYGLRQVWRAKEIFDSEGVSDPKHLIPMYKMSRLICLFITGETDRVDEVIPIVRRVVEGDGLDVVKVKELLREHLEHYEDWAPELDRIIRWANVAFGPQPAAQPYVEENVLPLAEIPHYASKFRNIPSASQLYEAVLNKPGLPLDPSFSNLVSRVAPYLNFRQIQFFLEARASSDWQAADLRRIRYVYSIKRKVLDIAESYGGLSFLPQSFLVSVFLGEATRTSMRASTKFRKKKKENTSSSVSLRRRRTSVTSRVRRRRKNDLEAFHREVHAVGENCNMIDYYGGLTPAERVASLVNLSDAYSITKTPEDLVVELESKPLDDADMYELGDSLLGPQDVAVLLQAGLTSVMKSSTVVQLNQRMLLDLICSQPRTFAVAVLSEIGSPSGQGSPRGLTSALMSLLELDQTAFKPHHQIDMHRLLETWLPGLKIPKREDYMAGGRWARQSYYEALFSVATSILEDAEQYAALKGHLQRVRRHSELDPIPQPRDEPVQAPSFGVRDDGEGSGSMSRLKSAVQDAKTLIAEADKYGGQAMLLLLDDEGPAKKSEAYKTAVTLYYEAFAACAKVRALDKHSFHATWFRDFYKRNYDALMIKSMYDNVVGDVDNTRYW